MNPNLHTRQLCFLQLFRVTLLSSISFSLKPTLNSFHLPLTIKFPSYAMRVLDEKRKSEWVSEREKGRSTREKSSPVFLVPIHNCKFPCLIYAVGPPAARTPWLSQLRLLLVCALIHVLTYIIYENKQASYERCDLSSHYTYWNYLNSKLKFNYCWRRNFGAFFFF